MAPPSGLVPIGALPRLRAARGWQRDQYLQLSGTVIPNRLIAEIIIMCVRVLLIFHACLA